jgi:hypothetical protein
LAYCDEHKEKRLVTRELSGYDSNMIIIRFTDDASKRRALGYLAGRFSFKSWATGEMMVPPAALPYLAVEGISYQVEGPATYEQLASAVRTPPTPAVQ